MRLPQTIPGGAVNPMDILGTIQNTDFLGLAQNALLNKQYGSMREAANLTPPSRRESPVRPGEAAIATGAALLAKLLGAKDEDVSGGFNGYMGQRQSQADNAYQNDVTRYEGDARKLGVEGQIAGMQLDHMRGVIDDEARRKQNISQMEARAAEIRLKESSDLVQKLMNSKTAMAARINNNALKSLGSSMAMTDEELGLFEKEIESGKQQQYLMKMMPVFMNGVKEDANPVARAIGIAGITSLLENSPDELMIRGYNPAELRAMVTPREANINADTAWKKEKTLTESALRGPKRDQILQNIKTSATRAGLNVATANFLQERTRLYDDEFALKKFDREIDLYRADVYAQAVASGGAEGDPLKAATQQRMALTELLSVNEAQLKVLPENDPRRPELEAERDRLKAKMWDIAGESMMGDPRTLTNPGEIMFNLPDIQPELKGPIGGGGSQIRRPQGKSAAQKKTPVKPKQNPASSRGKTYKTKTGGKFEF